MFLFIQSETAEEKSSAVLFCIAIDLLILRSIIIE